jgi:hypothetical protein
MSNQPEVWLRGPIEGIHPSLMPVAHALEQAREDIQHLLTVVPETVVWTRPGGAASIGFHVQHLGGALDRLFTYARGEMLNDAQKAAMKAEAAPPVPAPALKDIVDVTSAEIDAAMAQLRATPPERLFDERRVGRAGLPSNVIGLLFHAAEHCTRHVGQAITTRRVLLEK